MAFVPADDGSLVDRFFLLQDLHELNQIVGASSSAVRVGAKRQLIDPLISSSPSVSSPAKVSIEVGFFVDLFL